MTIIGGFAVVAYSDTMHTIIMLVGCGLMLFIGLHEVGGWHALLAKVPDAMHIAKPYNDANYPFWGIIAGAIYGGTFYWGIDQVNVQRMLGSPDLNQARWGAMFAVLLKLTPVFIFAMPGVIALALYPGREPKTTFVTLLNNLLPSGVRGLVLAALLACADRVAAGGDELAVHDGGARFRTPRAARDGRTCAGLDRTHRDPLRDCRLGIAAAYLVYLTPDGLYKYLQTISIYLVMPVTPAIIFGIMSRRVTLAGAVASVLVGIVLATVFVTDQLIGVDAGQRLFPWLHTTLTLNYTYRGFWGTLCIVATLFAVSAFTTPTPPDKLEATTMRWTGRIEPLHGLSDWRLQLGLLGIVTVAAYAWLW